MVFMAVCAHAQINTDQVMNIGRNSLYFEDYILSIQYFNQVIKAKPYLAEPYFFRSVAKINLEDYKGAEVDATLCIERNPFIVDAYQVRGVARQNQRQFAAALDDYNKGLAQLPENKIFLMNKAICQLELKQYDQCDSSFKALLRVDPKNERAYLGLAQMNLGRNDTVQALDLVNQSLKISKNSALAYAMRAEINSRFLKNDTAALLDMDQLIKLQPQSAENFINRAFLKYHLDDYFGAMSDYDYAIGLAPNHVTAIYDRALLSAEVGEDAKAIDDFSKVLKLQPQNFLALYNRAQLYLRTRQFRKAVSDYDLILKKYPRFESGYMARAEAKRRYGDIKGSDRDNETAISIFKKKGIKVSTFNPAQLEVKKEEKRMAQEIERAREGISQPETEDEIMQKFNTLLTIAPTTDLKPEYDNRSRGHIQNSNIEIDPEPMFRLTYYSFVNKLNGKTNYMKELTEVNDTHLLPMLLTLSGDEVQLNEEDINKRFASIEYYNGLMTNSTPRSIDYFARAVDFMMVKNPESALADAERALEKSPKFALALFLKADAHYMQYLMAKNARKGMDQPTSADDVQAAAMLRDQNDVPMLALVTADLNEVLKLSPKNVYALYNKGNVYLLLKNYTSAISCYTEAIALKPDFGEAYYNRGLMYLRMGNKERGIADLSKAGELGILPSYNVLKRMTN